jgi:hypothetical protein
MDTAEMGGSCFVLLFSLQPKIKMQRMSEVKR